MTWEDIKDTSLEVHIRVRLANEACMDFEVYALTLWDDGMGDPYKFIGADLKPTPDINTAPPLIRGMIKFDGCSHSNFGDEHGYIHGCSREEMTRIGKIYELLFDIATKTIGKEFLAPAEKWPPVARDNSVSEDMKVANNMMTYRGINLK